MNPKLSPQAMEYPKAETYAGTVSGPVSFPDASTFEPDLETQVMQPVGLIRSEGMSLPDCKRFVVLIPDTDFDETRLGRKIWSLVPHFAKMEVLLVTLVSENGYQPEVQRRLINLASVISDTTIQIRTMTVKSRNWISALKGCVQPGDIIVSHKGLKDKTGGQRNQPLENLLADTLNTPVYVISSFYSEPSPHSTPRYALQAFLWLVLISIIAGFFILENDIYQSTVGWIRDMLVAMVVVLEIFLIYTWNKVKS